MTEPLYPHDVLTKDECLKAENAVMWAIRRAVLDLTAATASDEENIVRLKNRDITNMWHQRDMIRMFRNSIEAHEKAQEFEQERKDREDAGTPDEVAQIPLQTDGF